MKALIAEVLVWSGRIIVFLSACGLLGTVEAYITWQFRRYGWPAVALALGVSLVIPLGAWLSVVAAGFVRRHRK